MEIEDKRIIRENLLNGTLVSFSYDVAFDQSGELLVEVKQGNEMKTVVFGFNDLGMWIDMVLTETEGK